jgi:aryl-alcohol dehydrogenase
MEIQAALIRERGGPFQVEAVEMEAPRRAEILVRIVATGICHTDLVVRDQIPFSAPAILGHEGAGIVEQVGADVDKVRVGDHVVLTFASCGTCSNCLRGKPAYCASFARSNVGGCRSDGSCAHRQHGLTLWSNFFGQSSFASHALVHQRNVVRVASEGRLAYLGPLGCGLQTGAGAVLNSLKPAVGSSIAVFGLGSVGFAALMAAKVSGCALIVAVDINEDRLALATELGATHVINGNQVDAVETIRRISGGVDYVVEATGLVKVMAQCVDALQCTGTAVMLGAAPQGATIDIKASTLMRGITVKGVIEGDSVPDLLIPTLVSLFHRGLFPIDRLVKFYALEDVNQAVSDMEKGLVIKPVLRMPHEGGGGPA